MKFILDTQPPKRLSHKLNELGYDSIHTLDLPDRNNTKKALKIKGFITWLENVNFVKRWFAEDPINYSAPRLANHLIIKN